MAGKEVKGKASNKEKGSSEILNENGIVLYFYHHCFHSQKVLMALYEKQIPFTLKVIDVTKNEQFQPWFLNINPRGAIPVLKDGIKYIPSSKRILGYLEDNFSNGEYKRLVPTDKGIDVKQKITAFHDKVCRISPFMITIGTFVNNRWAYNFKYPYSLPFVKDSLKASALKSYQFIRKCAFRNPRFTGILLQRAQEEEKKSYWAMNQEQYLATIEEIKLLLNEAELELVNRDKSRSDWWLFTDSFTIADISLIVLMDRLSRLGMEGNFWKNGVRPHLEAYYHRAQQRISYKNSIPTLKTDLSFILRTRSHLILGVGIFTVLITSVVGGFLYFKS